MLTLLIVFIKTETSENELTSSYLLRTSYSAILKQVVLLICHPKSASGEENKVSVLLANAENPQVSSRQLSLDYDEHF